MLGLRETFDVAKRMALFVYIAVRTTHPLEFMTLLENYRDDHTLLTKGIQEYRSRCSYDPTRKKMQTGVVRIDSVASLNKYVRVAGELGLIDFEYTSSSPNSGLLYPNIISDVVGFLYERDESVENGTNYNFELSPNMKMLLFYLLLKKDSLYLISLAYAILEFDGSLKIDTVRTKIQHAFAKSLLDSMRFVIQTQIGTPESLELLSERILFVKKNYELLEQNRKPTRGLLHLIDPRIHWFYDLELVDLSELCKNGNVTLSDFWNHGISSREEFLHRIISDPDSLFYSYARRYSSGMNEPNPMIVIRRHLGILSDFYPRLVPLSALNILAKIELARKGTRLTEENLITHLQAEGIYLFRGFDGTIQFVESIKS